MYIPIPARDCRAAIALAIVAAQKEHDDDINKFKEHGYNQLLEGAIHNGLDVTEARKQEMRDMVDRDCEHIMQAGGGSTKIEMLQQMSKFLDYMSADYEDVVIDEQDFQLIGDFLPEKKVTEVGETGEKAA